MVDEIKTCDCYCNITLFLSLVLYGLYFIEFIFALGYITIGLQSQELVDRLLVGDGIYLLLLLTAKIYFYRSEFHWKSILAVLSFLSFIWIAISNSIREGKNNPITIYCMISIIFVVFSCIFQILLYILSIPNEKKLPDSKQSLI